MKEERGPEGVGNGRFYQETAVRVELIQLYLPLRWVDFWSQNLFNK